MAEKKTRAAKHFVSGKDGKDPRVLIAEDDKAALKRWAKITGRKEADGVARAIGTRAETITRETGQQPPKAEKETK